MNNTTPITKEIDIDQNKDIIKEMFFEFFKIIAGISTIFASIFIAIHKYIDTFWLLLVLCVSLIIAYSRKPILYFKPGKIYYKLIILLIYIILSGSFSFLLLRLYYDYTSISINFYTPKLFLSDIANIKIEINIWILSIVLISYKYIPKFYKSIKERHKNNPIEDSKQSLVNNESTGNNINLETIGNIAWHWAKNNLGMVDVDATPYCTDCKKRMIHDRQGFKYKCPDCNNIIHSGQHFIDSRNAAVKYITEKYENL